MGDDRSLGALAAGAIRVDRRFCRRQRSADLAAELEFANFAIPATRPRHPGQIDDPATVTRRAVNDQTMADEDQRSGRGGQHPCSIDVLKTVGQPGS
jgi:hypothetical protein